MKLRKIMGLTICAGMILAACDGENEEEIEEPVAETEETEELEEEENEATPLDEESEEDEEDEEESGFRTDDEAEELDDLDDLDDVDDLDGTLTDEELAEYEEYEGMEIDLDDDNAINILLIQSVLRGMSLDSVEIEYNQDVNIAAPDAGLDTQLHADRNIQIVAGQGFASEYTMSVADDAIEDLIINEVFTDEGYYYDDGSGYVEQEDSRVAEDLRTTFYYHYISMFSMFPEQTEIVEEDGNYVLSLEVEGDEATELYQEWHYNMGLNAEPGQDEVMDVQVGRYFVEVVLDGDDYYMLETHTEHTVEAYSFDFASDTNWDAVTQVNYINQGEVDDIESP